MQAASSSQVSHRVVISGCSSGGKSSLVEELAARGYQTVAEPGRRIIAEEQARGGTALPWLDGPAFVERAIEMSLLDIAGHPDGGDWVFFDRGLIDAAAAQSQLTGKPVAELLRGTPAFHPLVFLAPPWPEIYVNEQDRRHSLASAVQEYERLLQSYPGIGYDVVLLPRSSVAERADFVLRQLHAVDGPNPLR